MRYTYSSLFYSVFVLYKRLLKSARDSPMVWTCVALTILSCLLLLAIELFLHRNGWRDQIVSEINLDASERGLRTLTAIAILVLHLAYFGSRQTARKAVEIQKSPLSFALALTASVAVAQESEYDDDPGDDESSRPSMR